MLPLMKKSVALTIMVFLSLAGCAVGPDYQRPPVEVPKNWKEATPRDAESRIRWWEIFDNPELDVLEAQALVANQKLKGASPESSKRGRWPGSAPPTFIPPLTFDPSVNRQDFSANRLTATPQTGTSIGRFNSNLFTVPLDLSYEVDVWGRYAGLMRPPGRKPRASAADYESVLLTLTSDVAQNYFLLRSSGRRDRVVEAYGRAAETSVGSGAIPIRRRSGESTRAVAGGDRPGYDAGTGHRAGAAPCPVGGRLGGASRETSS